MLSQMLRSLMASNAASPLVGRLQTLLDERSKLDIAFQEKVLTRLSEGSMEDRTREAWRSTWTKDWRDQQEGNARWLDRVEAEVESFRKEHDYASSELGELDYALDLIRVRRDAGVPLEEPHWWLKRTPEQAKKELSLLKQNGEG